HDFWIAPTKMKAGPGDLIGVHLEIGHPPDQQSFPRESDRFESFTLTGPDGRATPIPGREHAYPAGITRPADPGLCVTGSRGKPSAVALEAETFESYIKEKGLDNAPEARKTRGDETKPVRESFSRAAKAVIAVGPDAARAGGFDRELGYTLELVP